MSQAEESSALNILSDAEKYKAENRADFMKRWFAIALSVGFATALSRMPWIEKGLIAKPELPVDYSQINQALRLTAATTATLLSWEGYLNSIRTKPLTDGIRFYIDVMLVTIYLVLLLTSASQHFWIWLHVVTFCIYVVWDFLSIGVHRGDYLLSGDPKSISRFAVYKGSLLGRPDVRSGPLVTLIWPIYLLSTAVAYQSLFSASQRASLPVTALFFVLIIYGLLGYRNDKGSPSRRPGVRLFRVLAASAFAVLLALGLSKLGHLEPVIFDF